MTPSNHESWGVHRVLYIPELLDLIFGFLYRRSNAINARVCKAWSSIALDALWRDMDNLRALFSLLAPLKLERSGYIFSRPPDTAGRKRFEFYSSRVRRLAYAPCSVLLPLSANGLQNSVFKDLSRTYQSLTILPNMDNLIWRGPLDHSSMFMHKRVKTFEIELSDKIHIPKQYFHMVAIRMPNLVGLKVKSYGLLPKYEEDVMDLVTDSWRCCLRAQISARLIPNMVVEGTKDVVPFAPALVEGAFPALRKLHIAIPFEDFSHFLSLEFAAKHLTVISVTSEDLETATSWQTLLAAVASHCQLLESLRLRSSRQTIANDPIPFEHLKLLFNLSNLKALDIHHCLPLALKQEDIESVAMAWPNLERLNLNDEPYIISNRLYTSLRLEALLPFVRHCPKLTHLGLLLYATNFVLPLPSSNVIPFKRLGCLSMGGSTIGDDTPRNISLYLSRILPAGCDLDFQSALWGDELDYDDTERVFQDLKQRAECWGEVARLLPISIQVRAEEQERLNIIEKEMRVRIRNELLSEGKKLGVER